MFAPCVTWATDHKHDVLDEHKLSREEQTHDKCIYSSKRVCLGCGTSDVRRLAGAATTSDLDPDRWVGCYIMFQACSLVQSFLWLKILNSIV